MKRIIFCTLFFTMGCALSPMGPLDSFDHQTPRRPAGTDQYQARAQQSWVAPVKLNSDIYMGMESEGVRSTWGRPEQVEYAGHPSMGQERWIYTFEIPTPNGYIRQKRIVYFERGRVVGWETQAK